MKTQFKNYLINRGYKVTTLSGNPSTVYDYLKRIDKVCEWENMSWSELATEIVEVILKYDVGGSKEEFGKRSHSAVISALKRFGEFVKTQ